MTNIEDWYCSELTNTETTLYPVVSSGGCKYNILSNSKVATREKEFWG